MAKQISIPCMLMRGGTSKGAFFAFDDLPQDIPTRDKVLLAVMGSPDKRQIDGLGGAHSLTTKVAMIRKSQQENVDLEFLFAQLQPDKDTVDTKPNCGNMLAAVVPFALEKGLIQPQGATTTARVLTLNTGMLADITVQTPDGYVNYDGDARIDGVPNSSAPIQIRFLDTEGSVCGALLPTGNVKDTFDIPNFGQLEATCIDNGMPIVLVRAADVKRTAYESVTELNNDTELKTILENLRLQAALKMGLGDVKEKNYPKMCLVNAPINGGQIHTRCFIPHVCHEAIGVLAAVTIATACVLKDSVAYGFSNTDLSINPNFSVEHPSGEFTVSLNLDEQGNVTSAALLRTARLLMKGEAMIPHHIWQQGA
ncbi:PrpF protein [Gallibacterium salpingitidis]|uniref:PrpF protein n=1 Tax=Gallibacterium salpingitidis TaxID=505341 RepID=A0AB36E578_9PAST|nr:4-oxalomesaconate tautomerase [Gallibacterium salpingitidis]OBX07158.1 PrpF protein [Gallibacterium salpingitidis]OBX12126.1 PrpF protein [Gallibacterium salpingitidis]WKS99818.1 4-oxalomesaconate tautomerase [Gallibacterium salpingitidis]